MIKKPSGLLSWDIKKIAEALKINIEEVKEYLPMGEEFRSCWREESLERY